MEKRIISSSSSQLPKGVERLDRLPTEVLMWFLNGLPLSGPCSHAGFISGESGEVGRRVPAV